MKNLMFVAVMLMLFIFVECSQVAAPTDVSSSFAMTFDKAEKVKWEQEEDNIWEAEFKMDGAEMSASFDAKGNWLETEKEMNKKDLPEVIFKAVSMEFEGFEIEEVGMIETGEYSGFEMEIEKEEGQEEVEYEIIVSKEGKILKKELIKDEDEDEEDEGEDEDIDEDEDEDEG